MLWYNSLILLPIQNLYKKLFAKGRQWIYPWGWLILKKLQSDINSQKNMIKIAINNAIASAQKTTQDKMNSVTGGMLGDMNIPGL